MRTITLDDIKQAAAALDPDEDNHGECLYTRQDGGHCVAGQILTNLGVKVPAYGASPNDYIIGPRLEDEGAMATGTPLTETWLPRYAKVTVEPDAARALRLVQRHADDNGARWGDCLAKAGLVD